MTSIPTRRVPAVSLLRLLRLFAAVLFVSLSARLPAADAARVFRAGAVTVDITPTNFPVIVNGGFLEKTADKANDPLLARALALDDGSTRLVLCVVDTCMMPRDLVDHAKELAQRQTGLPADRMLVSATHTHSAPAAMACLGSRADTNYVAFLPGKIAEAIVGAMKNLEPARIGWASVDDWDHTFNRRWIRRPDKLIVDPFGNATGRAHMHPGHQNPDAIGPSGPVDPELSVLAVTAKDGTPLALLANYSQHYFGATPLSADYYGRFAEHIASFLAADVRRLTSNAERGAPFVAIMSQGTSGDLMWMDYAAPRRHISHEAYAKEVAERALEAYRKIKWHDWVPLKMAEAKLPLNYRVPDAERLAWARKIAAIVEGRLPKNHAEIYAFEALHLHARQRTELKLQALRIGDLAVTAIPNEVYAITGLKLKAQSPFPATFNIELANGAEGYIPPPEQHALGGYTTWPARTAGLEVQAEPKIVETLLKLLEEVTGRERRPLVEIHGPYAEAVLESKPRAYWRLNEIFGDSAFDATGANHTAAYEPGIARYLPGVGSGTGVTPAPALTTSAFSGAGQINRAAHFAGGRLKAALPATGRAYAVVMWFWNGLTNTARPVTGYLLSRGPDGDKSASGIHLGIGGTHRGDLTGRLIVFNGNKLNQVLAGRALIEQREWHHVAFVREGSRVTVYLDGVPEPEIAGELEESLAAPSPELFIGGRNDNFANFEGKIDEVAVYDRALTAQEVAAHFKASGLAPPQRRAGIPPASPTAPSPNKSQETDRMPALQAPPLSPAAALKTIRVPQGFEVELIAAEPLTMDPVAIDWDEHGRLWVVEMADYPSGMDGNGKPGGRVRWLEDANDDGRYDKSTLFADGLNFPNGILTWRDGVIVTAAPDILFLRDTNGDGRADERRVLFTGFFEGNQQLRVNGLRWGLDNWVYCANGGHHAGYGDKTKIVSKLTGKEIELGSRDFRFRPDTGQIEPESGPTQFGRNRDDWGNWFGTQNSWPLWHYVLPDRYLRRNPHVAAPGPVRQIITPANPKVYPASAQEKRFHSFNEAGRFTSACSGMVYRDALLFDRACAHAFTCEPFHNLVQHNIITDDGVSFTFRRAPEEAKLDFFASEDRWCRPVMTRTGPDGALWVVDMYRYMIEHPQWLPANGREELLPHYRQGDDKGRIWRVVPVNDKGERLRAKVNLAAMSTAQLVAALDSPNGWLRDKVQQLLLWKGDKAALPLLGKAALENASPYTRLHALCTLDGLNALKPELVERALADAHPGVRINALRLAETRGTPAVIAAATKLAADTDPKVRLQLAFSLGEWKDARAGQALAELAVKDHGDPFLLAAVASSAAPHCAALVAAAAEHGGTALATLSGLLMNLSLGVNDRDSLARLLTPTLAANHGRFTSTQVAAFGQFLEVLSRRNVSLSALRATEPEDLLARQLRHADALFAFAGRMAADPMAPIEDRAAAAGLLAREPSQRGRAMALLSGWLSPQTPGEVQRVAVRSLALTGDDQVPAKVLEHWVSFAPETRAVALEVLLGREAWAHALLQRVKAEEISPLVFDATRRAQLQRHSSNRVRGLANQLFKAGASSRARVVEQFRPALALKGDAARGQAVYVKLCAVCHKSGDTGNDVGPDLRAVVEHPPEKLLVNILDPSSDVQPGFFAYTATLRNGVEFYGIIVSETGNSITMKLADGSVRVILRGDIGTLRGANLSLMPEGLEAGLTAQDMADLIAWIKTPRAE